ncbi:phage tail assembly protein [Rhizobium panacihumi]|uniref:phage tail assembly protein n=1 Tax=Rhizobium panacihumi TaxID=2008450 RepID=UPI003D78FC0C
MDQVTKAATPEQIAAFEATKAHPVTRHVAKQVLPAGFEASKTIGLTVPVEFDGTVYSEVHIRRLKGRDFLKLQQMTGNEDVSLLAIVTAIPAAVIEELDAEDFVTLSEAAQDFLPRALRQAVAQTSDNGPGSQQ